MTDQHTVDRKEYNRRRERRAAAKRSQVITALRTGPWTPAEDAIILRDDITTVEMMAMVQRGENAISKRLSQLQHGPIIHCEHCRQEFYGQPVTWFSRSGRQVRFCSVACHQDSVRVPLAQCPVCERTYKPERRGKVVCSRKCGNILHSKRAREKSHIKVIDCPTCGNEFRADATSTKNGVTLYRKYCSRNCFIKGIKGKHRNPTSKNRKYLAENGVDCINCGRHFVPSREEYSGCCSITCWGSVKSQRHVAEHTKPCEHCGADFVAKISQRAGNRQRFCSKRCSTKFAGERRRVEAMSRTHCLNGHAYIVAGRITSQGKRVCKACEAANRARRKSKAKPECSVDGCSRTVIARGWCATHHSRWRKHADVRADVPVLRYRSRLSRTPSA